MKPARGLANWATLALVAAGSSAPTLAHHSFATYDMATTTTVTGTVREFQWINPHSWIKLSAPDEKGVMQDLAIEAGAVVGLRREGWTRDDFKAGDKVTISFHPRKDGVPGGAFVTAVTASGRKLGSQYKQLTTPTATVPAAAPAAAAQAPAK
jgi:hypothetical protein